MNRIKKRAVMEKTTREKDHLIFNPSDLDVPAMTEHIQRGLQQGIDDIQPTYPNLPSLQREKIQ